MRLPSPAISTLLCTYLRVQDVHACVRVPLDHGNEERLHVRASVILCSVLQGSSIGY